MSVVLGDFLDVIVPVDVIEAKYPGGLAAYATISSTFCTDGHLTRLGFMSDWAVHDLLRGLEEVGFVIVEDGRFRDVAALSLFGSSGARRPSWLVVSGGAVHHADYPPGELALPE